MTNNDIEKKLDEGGVCYYCGEPFKECDTIIPGVGVIIGDVDIKKYKKQYLHRGCIIDFKKKKIQS